MRAITKRTYSYRQGSRPGYSGDGRLASVFFGLHNNPWRLRLLLSTFRLLKSCDTPAESSSFLNILPANPFPACRSDSKLFTISEDDSMFFTAAARSSLLVFRT